MTDVPIRHISALSAPRVGLRVSPAAALGTSVIALGLALQKNFGLYDPLALVLLAIAIVSALRGVVAIAKGDEVTTGRVTPVLYVSLLTRFSAASIIVIMIGAILKVHLQNGFFAPRGFEFNLALIGLLLPLLILGPGNYAVGVKLPKWAR